LVGHNQKKVAKEMFAKEHAGVNGFERSNAAIAKG
jgi:hypothetical protein